MSMENISSEKRNLQGDANNAVPTAGEVFHDGCAIELVRTSASGDLALLFWDGKNVTIRSRCQHRGRTYRPTPLEDSIGRVLQLPGNASPYGSTSLLFAEVVEQVNRYTEIPEPSVTLLAAFVFSTWFSDCLRHAPVLYLVGAAGCETAVLVKLLNSLCRHSLTVGALTPAAFCSLPMFVHPTLLITEYHSTVSLDAIIRASSQSQVYIPRDGRLLDLFCTKVICNRDASTDFAGEGCIKVSMNPWLGTAVVLDDKEAKVIAGRFQPQFLHYRLSSYQQVLASDFDVPWFTSPTRALARSLGASLVGVPELRSQLIELLRDQDEEVRTEQSVDESAIIIEALLLLCHETKQEVHVGEVADVVNNILHGRGEALRLAPREVGARLKSLGFPTRRLGSAGRGLRFLKDQRERMHHLARSYSVRSTELESCAHCMANRARSA
jgi:hypothetical protein